MQSACPLKVVQVFICNRISGLRCPVLFAEYLNKFGGMGYDLMKLLPWTAAQVQKEADKIETQITADLHKVC